MYKRTLEALIEQALSQILEQEETPAEKRKRLRDKFKGVAPAQSTTTDLKTQEGRENITEMIIPSFVSLLTRIQILDKMIMNSVKASSKREFYEFAIQMFDNVEKLKNIDMKRVEEAYANASKAAGIGITEADYSVETPDGRRNIMRNAINAVGRLKALANEGDKMLQNASTIPNAAVFLNEMKALGKKIKEMRAQATVVDTVFAETFPAYKKRQTSGQT